MKEEKTLPQLMKWSKLYDTKPKGSAKKEN